MIILIKNHKFNVNLIQLQSNQYSKGAINTMQSHFNAISNYISLLEGYYNINGESIFALDLEIREFIDNNDNDVNDWIDSQLTKQQPIIIRTIYELLEIDIKIYQYFGREQALGNNDWNSELFALIKQSHSNNIKYNTISKIWLSSNKNLTGIKESLKGMNMNFEITLNVLNKKNSTMDYKNNYNFNDDNNNNDWIYYYDNHLFKYK